mgnify:CR=1 FL=1
MLDYAALMDGLPPELRRIARSFEFATSKEMSRQIEIQAGIVAAWLSEANECARIRNNPSLADAAIAKLQAEVDKLRGKIEELQARRDSDEPYFRYRQLATEANENRKKMAHCAKVVKMMRKAAKQFAEVYREIKKRSLSSVGIHRKRRRRG